MRILFLTFAYPPELGGLAESSRRIVSGLRTRGHEVIVFAPGANAARDPQSDVVRIGDDQWNSARELDLLSSAARALHEAQRFDLVFGFFIYPPGFAAAYLAAQIGAPCIVSARGNDIGKYLFSFPEKIEWALNNCAHVCCVSQELRDLLAHSWSGRAGVSVIQNAVSIPPDRPDFGRRAPTPTVAIAGIIRWKKGWSTFLEALTLVRHRVHGKLIGDVVEAEKSAFEADAKHKGVDVEITGLVDEAGVAREMQTIDVFVSASFTDGMPNVLLKAVCAGRPAIVSDISGHTALIRDESHGLVFEPGNGEALARAIDLYIGDRDRAAKAAARAYDTLCEEFGERHELDRYERLFAAVVNRAV